MTHRTQKPAAAVSTPALAWDVVTPRELAFQFPRLTAPIKQLPDVFEEPQCRRLTVLERLFRWLDEQF